MHTHIARFAAGSQSCEGFTLRSSEASHSPSNRPIVQTVDPRQQPAFYLSARMTWESKGNHSLHGRNGANIPASRYGLGDLERMEHAKLANGSRHESPIGRSTSLADQDQKDAARPDE
jgi:hypothetical protein